MKKPRWPNPPEESNELWRMPRHQVESSRTFVPVATVLEDIPIITILASSHHWATTSTRPASIGEVASVSPLCGNLGKVNQP